MNMNLDNNPHYLEAVKFIEENDLSALEPGKHVINGDNLWVNIIDTPLKTPEQARLEVHDAYIDIQVPISGAEGFGLKPRRECTEPDGEYDAGKDILFYKDKDWTQVTLEPGQAITICPDTAHAPMIGEGAIRKAIFKVRVVQDL